MTSVTINRRRRTTLPKLVSSSSSTCTKKEGLGSGSLGTTAAATTNASTVEIKKKNQLFLLRHAFNCKAPPGTCHQSRHCHSIKLLWRHISHCKEENCVFPHCTSSRIILTHFNKCIHETYPVRSPVPSAPKY